ncbi:hypothetical protein TYRP_010243 [Tyrophagus putrescentiae]|nr:hypothetical protein TYRP_010243 [Tyrophagus putrescentiae]
MAASRSLSAALAAESMPTGRRPAGEDVKGGGHHEGGDDRIGEQNGEDAQSEGANGELMIITHHLNQADQQRQSVLWSLT